MSLHIRSRPSYGPVPRMRPIRSSYLVDPPRTGSSAETVPLEIDTEAAAGSLPIMATANDARELVRFLKRRPNGVTVVEAMNAEPRRIFDARKIAAYEFWGIIRRENERLTLTDLGEGLADALEPECRMHRDILRGVPAYQTALKSIFEERLDIATHLDVLQFWSMLRIGAGSELSDPLDMEAAVVCFFSLCHAAELGTSTVGKRGQPARLRVDMEQIARFLSEDPGLHTSTQPHKKREYSAPLQPVGGSLISHVLISKGGSVKCIDSLVSLLNLAGFESTTVDFDDLGNGLLPSSDLTEMQKCQAGIFVISANDCTRKKDGTFSLRPEWITKISVAAALFDWRILLFWNGKLPPPEELTASGLRFLSSEVLDWDASLELANQIKTLTSV